MMVDYSKWNKMADDMSDSDEADSSNQPQVTTFDEPQSITFGGTAASLEAQSKHEYTP